MRFFSLVDSLVFSGVVISIQGRRRTGEEQGKDRGGTGEEMGKEKGKPSRQYFESSKCLNILFSFYRELV